MFKQLAPNLNDAAFALAQSSVQEQLAAYRKAETMTGKGASANPYQVGRFYFVREANSAMLCIATHGRFVGYLLDARASVKRVNSRRDTTLAMG